MTGSPVGAPTADSPTEANVFEEADEAEGMETRLVLLEDVPVTGHDNGPAAVVMLPTGSGAV